tara:strand:- start:224 stop:826 length:603 start_codon:yes stop_codon:yes gene_type:complete
MNRKKKLKYIQITLLFLGTILLVFTYSQKNNKSQETIILKETLEEINKDLSSTSSEEDKFYNITYRNLDLNGNRYILKSKEAESNKIKAELVKMKFVTAKFYFNNGTTLDVTSDRGIYNNKTLDMKFDGNIKAYHNDSELFAEKAEYSNSKNFLSITEDVTVIDVRGKVLADKIFFDLKKNTVDIEAFENKKVNATIKQQ